MRDTSTLAEASSGQATLILADITGHTRFLSGVSDAHATQMESGETPAAYPLMTTLLDSIVHSLVPPFALAKLEGDAVFAFANDGTLDVREQSIAGSVELLGPDVTTAHRMLKNQVTATTGWSAYALVSDAAAAYLRLADDGAKRLRLEYEHVGTVEALAIPLDLPG